MIIATAGHVDHGKTELVKTLTGIDTDTLVEEKKRGLSIDLGFAYLPVCGQLDIGFVDVPGHDRFIKNALCGLAAADFVLLLVAADDGPMPQTREHLAIIDLLGIRRGAIVISKCDRVSDERIVEVVSELKRLTSGTSLADWPLQRFSCFDNSSVERLKQYLLIQASESTDRSSLINNNNFRLAIDRVFVKKGVGVIVTGTIFSGSIRQGDRVTIAGSNKKLRVRGLRIQNNESVVGAAGQRCAINLAGVELNRQEIKRGHWVTSPEVVEPVFRFDAELRLLADATPLKHWTPVHLHHAASQSTARVAVLDGGAIQPGKTGLVQIVSDKPVMAVFDDKFIIRDQSARDTLGGGRVIDIFPPKRGRAKSDRLHFLQYSNDDNVKNTLKNLLAFYADAIDLNQFVKNRNLRPEVATELLAGFDEQLCHKQQKNTVEFESEPNVESHVHWPAFAKALDRGGIRGLLISEAVESTGVSPDQVSSLLTSGVRQGLVVKLSNRLLITPQHLELLKNIVIKLDQQNNNSCFNVSEFREATELGRNRAIEILESFDRQGITRRDGQQRMLLPMAERRFDQLLKQVE